MDINLSGLTPDIRKLGDMKEVIFDKKWLESAEDFDLYYMYRKVKQENGLNHNITVIPAKMLGIEFIKTAGHIHVGPQQEIYTVEEGEAIFLMSRITGSRQAGQKNQEYVVEDVFAVKAKKGESVVIPSFYGHVTINPSDKDLKTGDWSSVNTKSDYSLFKRLCGACYFYIKERGEAKWIKNGNYKNVPELRFEEPLKETPENLDFLKNE